MMDKGLFAELLESVREAGQIKRGKRRAARTFKFTGPDIRAIRERAGLSQAGFAHLMGVSVDTLETWEQGRRKPRGPALALLKVAQTDLETIVRAVHA